MTDVRLAAGPEEVEAALALRERVFVGQQGVTLAADQDGLDGEATHIVAIDDGRLVGTCRLVFEDGLARLGRMAVESSHRGAGLGAAILERAERAARAEEAQRIRLHAQEAAVTLYERGGFHAVGEAFLEEGIRHVTMEKDLA